MLEYETARMDDIGGREEQQDRVAVLGGAGTRLLALADGVGGHEGGAQAAQALIDVAKESFGAFGRSPEGAPARLLERIVLDAHERINALGRERGMKPHSTCVLLHLSPEAAAWAHVGDSRLYRFAEGRLAERTLDHSIVELMRLQGRVAEAEMRTHPDRNRLYEALGGDRPPQAEAGGKEIAAGDGFLLASDGVWENVADADLEAAIQAEHLADGLRRLVDGAKARGGPECDNLSVAAARVRAAPSGKRSFRSASYVARPRTSGVSPAGGREGASLLCVDSIAECACNPTTACLRCGAGRCAG